MQVTQVAIRPTEASNTHHRPALTPELLAATGARYSRSNEGLQAILARIDWENLDKSVESIFRMVDYGHQSIADMAPVALFIDGISLYLAYYLWTICPTAGGQESSTRYIKLTTDALIDAEALGIAPEQRGAWQERMERSFVAYRDALAFWENLADKEPERVRLPTTLRNDPSEKAKRQVARMVRNYAFDRSRYFLPVAASTNVMLVMSARAWVSVCGHLLSHPLKEMQTVGAAVREELGIATPHLLKHAVQQTSRVNGLAREFAETRHLALTLPFGHGEMAPTPFLNVFTPGMSDIPIPPAEVFAHDLAFHDNRYAYVGESLRRTTVRFGWSAVALAEIRDLNRHRTGNKYCPMVPRGFYFAADQLSTGVDTAAPIANAEYATLGKIGMETVEIARERLLQSEPDYVYETLLGTQYLFEHVTTADKFLYEAELRTGIGAHFRYAKHLHDALELWYAEYPQTRGLVLEGSAEPE